MKVIMLACQSGPEVLRAPGDVLEVDIEEGGRMIASGIAAPAEAVVETATAPAIETAVANRKKKR